MTLTKSEIKRATKKANELNNSKDCVITGYFTDGIQDEIGFIKVECEVLHNFEERAEKEVTIEVFMPDRRRSWVHETHRCHR